MFLQVLIMMGRVIVQTFTSPLFLCIYMGLFFLVAWQYRRLQQMSADILQVKMPSYLKPALVSALLGLVGAAAGSIMLVFVGIDLGNIAIVQLWLVALLLMLINPRFLCFAYAGGVLALCNLATGYPQMNVSALMGLVAVLHMVESILIWLNGHLDPVPVYVRQNGGMRGGFNLQKFWPLPLVAMAGMNMIGGSSGVVMPDWWPLLNGGFTGSASCTLIPVLAVLGYGEINTTRTPAQASRRSSFHLWLYSIILLTLAVLASRYRVLLVLCALFSPLGHELVIWLGLREEKNRPPIYIKSPQGVMTLAVIPGSPAARAGIVSSDIILSVNGKGVNDFPALKTELIRGWGDKPVNVCRQGKMRVFTYRGRLGAEPGIIAAPEAGTTRFLVNQEDLIFILVRRLWQRIRS